MRGDICIDAFISVPGGTEIMHDLQPADDKVEIQFRTALDKPMVRIGFDDPETLTQLIKAAFDARAELMTQLGRELTPGSVSETMMLPAGSGQSEPIFGAYDEIA